MQVKHLLLLTVLMTGCASNKKALSTKLLVELEKTACFGECPVYSMKIFQNGMIELKGKMYLHQIGEYQLQLNQSELRAIQSGLDEVAFCELNASYGSNALDFPSSFIRAYCDGEIKQVEAVMDIPEKLIEFIKKLDDMRNRSDWQKTEIGADTKK